MSPIKANHSLQNGENSNDSNIHISPSYDVFRKQILENIRPCRNSTFNGPNLLGLTYLNSMRFGLGHNFRDSLNPICNWSNATESTKHNLFHWLDFPE